MRPSIPSPSTAASPVVATYRSRASADESLGALMRAGFRPEMLELVGHRSGEGDACVAAARPVRRARPAGSGLLLGAAWSAFACAATLVPAPVDLRLALVAATGALVLTLQARLVAQALRPQALGRRPAESGAPSPPSQAETPSAWRFQLVVHGSRAEVALARDIVAH